MAKTLIPFLVVVLMLTRFVAAKELLSKDDPSKKEKPYTCKLFDALLENGGKWSGTLTIGDKELKVACLTATPGKLCAACPDRGIFLAFKFNRQGQLPKFGTTRAFPSFDVLTPIINKNKLFVAEHFHGIEADLTYGSELVLSCDRTSDNGHVEYKGKIEFYYENDYGKPPTVTANVLIRLREGRLTGNISGEKLEAIRFAFKRLASKDHHSTK